MLLTLVVRHGIHEKQDPPLQGRSFVYTTLRTATRVRVLQSLAVRSPESKLQKMPGARRRLRANGMTKYALTHQQLLLWINDSAHQNCPTDFEAILTHN